MCAQIKNRAIENHRRQTNYISGRNFKNSNNGTVCYLWSFLHSFKVQQIVHSLMDDIWHLYVYHANQHSFHQILSPKIDKIMTNRWVHSAFEERKKYAQKQLIKIFLWTVMKRNAFFCLKRIGKKNYSYLILSLAFHLCSRFSIKKLHICHTHFDLKKNVLLSLFGHSFHSIIVCHMRWMFKVLSDDMRNISETIRTSISYRK